MSWLSKETGRPKEDGGHQRINISTDYSTRQVLDHVKNKSQFIEHSIQYFTNVKCVHLEEKHETCNESKFFKDAAIFEVTPYFVNNTVQQVNTSFNFLSKKGEIAFRVIINGTKGETIIERTSSGNYSLSHNYNLRELGFRKIEAMLRNNDEYIIKFQFRSTIKHLKTWVKNINIFVDFIEKPIITIAEENIRKENDFVTIRKVSKT